MNVSLARPVDSFLALGPLIRGKQATEISLKGSPAV